LKEKKISAFSALTAKTFKHYLFTYHRKLFVDFLRNSNIVKLLVMKVYDAVTLIKNFLKVCIRDWLRVVFTHFVNENPDHSKILSQDLCLHIL
jgi:hypothetical protein